MSQINFLTETLSFMKEFQLRAVDIKFIGSGGQSGHSMSFEEFLKAADALYDNENQFRGVAGDLVIVFNDDTVMYRHYREGYQGWGVRQKVKTIATKKITTLVADDSKYPVDGYPTLGQLNPE